MVEPNRRSGSHSGRWTVAAMFGFAIMMVTLLFVYWEFYTAPFRPLQYAIAAAFPESSPRVVGGQHKSHKSGDPKILRIVVYVPDSDFDPEQSMKESENRAADLVRLAFEHQKIDEYEQIEVVLLQKVPESARKRWSKTQSVAEWQAVL